MSPSTAEAPGSVGSPAPDSPITGDRGVYLSADRYRMSCAAVQALP